MGGSSSRYANGDLGTSRTIDGVDRLSVMAMLSRLFRWKASFMGCRRDREMEMAEIHDGRDR